MNLPRSFKNKIASHKPLAGLTTLGIGGRARFWYEPRNRPELVRFLAALDPRFSVFVMGAGSNLLLSDGLIDKVFVHLSAPAFSRIDVRGARVTVGAGARLGRVVSVLSTKDIGGYEFLAGIPGTVGGALAMNAGSRSDFDRASSYREIKDIVAWVEVVDRKGKVRRLLKKDVAFGYRCSDLKPYVILKACLRLKRDDKKAVQKRLRRLIARRFEAQEWRYPSAGSFFRNPPNAEPAGRLIDSCGLKGMRVGGAQVSAKHANFIVNVREAKSADVLKLVEIIREKVYNRFQIELEPEVEFVT